MTPRTNYTEAFGNGRLEGEVAIISGGSGGMGGATATVFAKEGAKVAIHYSGLSASSNKRASDTANRIIKSGGKATLVKADVSRYAEVKKVVSQVSKKWGKVSLVVCFAGLPSDAKTWKEDPLELDDSQLLSAVYVDFLGSYNFIRACKHQMKKNRYGKIVLISSSPVIYGEDIGYRFTLAKDLNRQTVKSLAPRLVRNYGVYLNAIAPGTVETRANRKNYTQQQWGKLISGIPLRRAGKPEEIAKVALFLCSHDSDYVVGQTIVTDGGEIRL